MINRRGWIVLAFMAIVMAGVLLHSRVRADDPRLPNGVSCETIRAHVATYGETIALAWARVRYSRAQIELARRCLRDDK